MARAKTVGKYKIHDEYNLLCRENKCPNCKKIFITSVSASEWGFSVSDGTKMHMCCSYTCMKKVEEPILERKRKKIAKEFRLAGNLEMEDAILANAI